MIRFVHLLLPLSIALPLQASSDRPNVVIIFADDLGFGDVSCNGAKPGLTPNVDRLRKEGLNFTDAHTTSATCTPSRYGLLTGKYPWRKRGTGVLPGDARLIIEPGTITLATVLKKAGYRTGVVGKWHLGLGSGKLDWNADISPGPLELGFDESFIMAATGDRVPCVFIRDHRVVGLNPASPIEVRYDKPFAGLPTGRTDPQLLRLHPSHGHDMAIVDGISRIGFMKGGESALWKDEAMAETFTHEAVGFIKRHKSSPFFLYFATHDIHVPRVPHPRFTGKSGMGPRGDAIVEFDWSVGQVLSALDESGVTANTLVVLTSDNGPVVDDGYRDDAAEKLGGHKPAGPFRGGKYSRFEGGTRVPFMVRWPGRVKPGTSKALVSQVDFVASFAALVNSPDGNAAGLDSRNQLPALKGDDPVGRETLIEHSGGLAARQGKWKYIPASNGPARNVPTNSELGNAPEAQLFNLDADPGETQNLAARHPEIVERIQREITAQTTQAASPSPARAERARTVAPTLFDGFEDRSVASFWLPGNYGSGLYVPGSITPATRHVRSGRQSVQITIRKGDVAQAGDAGTHVERDELDSGHFPLLRQEAWYGFSLLIPEDLPILDERLVISSCKQSDVSRPLVAQRFRDGRHSLTVEARGKKNAYHLPTIQVGKWVDMIYRVRYSPDETGILQVWMNGKRVVAHAGPLAEPGRKNAIYNKIGLYRDRLEQPMTIYFDNYTMGSSLEAVDPARFDKTHVK